MRIFGGVRLGMDNSRELLEELLGEMECYCDRVKDNPSFSKENVIAELSGWIRWYKNDLTRLSGGKRTSVSD